MRPVAVFDIDGVLADVGHRLHHVQARPKDWRAFFAAADRDPVLAQGADLLRCLQDEHEIRYLTGRPERLRTVTVTWLAGHDLPSGAPLAMRPNRDFRPSRTFKRERLQAWLAEGAHIHLVIDDDPAVVDMVAALGLRVLRAQWQDSPTVQQQTLWSAQEDLGRT